MAETPGGNEPVGTVVTPPASAGSEPQATPFDGDKFWDALPDEQKQYVFSRASSAIDERLNEVLGPDVAGLMSEAVKDESFRKQLSKLSDRELRQFALNDGVEVYEEQRARRRVSRQDTGHTGNDGVAVEPTSGVEAELATIKSKLEEREQREYVAGRNQERGNEFIALAREVPELNFTKADASDPRYKLANHIVKWAEKQTAWDPNGRETSRYTYKQAWDDYVEAVGAQTAAREYSEAPVIPATSRSGPPATDAQAPKTPAEAKQRGLEILKKAGGITGLARQSARR